MELTINVEDNAIYNKILRYLKRQPKVIIKENEPLKALLLKIEARDAGQSIRFTEEEFDLYNEYLESKHGLTV